MKLVEQRGEFFAGSAGAGPDERMHLDDEAETSAAGFDGLARAIESCDFIAFDVEEDPVGLNLIGGAEFVDGGERDGEFGVLLGSFRVRFAKTTESGKVGGKELRLRASVTHTFGDDRNAVMKLVATDVSREHLACVGIGLKGENFSCGTRPAAEAEGVDADVRANVKAD